MPTKKYLDYTGLSTYDQKIKEYIDDADNAIEGDVADLKSAIYESQNLDYGGATLYGCIISGTTGKWYVSNDYQSYFVPIPENAKKISITANDHNAAIFALLKNTSHTNGQYPAYATGSTRTVIAADATQTFDIPADAKYVYLMKSSATADLTPAAAVYAIDTMSILTSDIVESEKAIDSLAVDSDIPIRWVQGGFNNSTGEWVSTQSQIQYSGSLPQGAIKISCDSGYKFLLQAWDISTGTYIGHRYTDGTFGKDSSIYGFLTECYLDHTLGYRYKVGLLHTDASAITVDEYAHCHILMTQQSHDVQAITMSRMPTFVGQPETIFENDDSTAQPDIDGGMLNYVCVLKISESMYYMYYECCASDVQWAGYDMLRLCLAYSTDGLHFTKGIPAGIEAPIPGTNQLLPIATTTGHSVVKVPDPDYPYRMVAMQAVPDRVAQLWKSADAVHWTLIRTITNGYNDSQASVVVRGNLLKIFLRTRNSYGRVIGIITTDLEGNRQISRWTSIITSTNYWQQLYTSAAAPLDDHREILFPTIYNPSTSEEKVGCIIVDGGKAEFKELDLSAIMPNDVKSIYIGPGIVDIGLKTYLYYETRDSDHEHAVIGTTRSAYRRIEITDETVADRVSP